MEPLSLFPLSRPPFPKSMQAQKQETTTKTRQVKEGHARDAKNRRPKGAPTGVRGVGRRSRGARASGGLCQSLSVCGGVQGGTKGYRVCRGILGCVGARRVIMGMRLAYVWLYRGVCGYEGIDGRRTGEDEPNAKRQKKDRGVFMLSCFYVIWYDMILYYIILYYIVL